ncbi:MAG TPA: hypothetical protein VF635_13125 [Propionibacteriaceae bacterium]
MSPRRNKRSVAAVLGVLAILLGLLWVGQGLNLIPGSFMTGDPTWFVIGAILTLVGVLLVFVGRGGTTRRP